MFRKVKHENKWLIVFFITVFIISLGFWLLNAINVNPVIKINNPKPPKPNAYDYYLAAANSIVDKTKLAYVANKKHNVVKGIKPDPNDRYYSPAEKESIVNKNRIVLKTFREGFNYEYLDPNTIKQSLQFLPFAKFRELARLIRIESNVYAKKGDYKNAVNSSIDGVRFGTDIYKGGGLIGFLVGIAVEAITMSDVGDYVNHLNSKEAKSASKRLEFILNHKYTLAQVYKNEKRLGIKLRLEIINKNDWRKGILALTSSSKPSILVPLYIKSYTVSKKNIIYNYANYIDLVIESCNKPYSINSPEIPVPNDPLNENIGSIEIMGWFGKKLRFKNERAIVKERFFLLQLAMRAYRLDNGKYPDALNDLTPNYLTKVPIDPFGGGKAFKYKRNGNNFILYSLGPDCKDDGGSAANTNKYIDQNSKGDIVFGVNKNI